MALYATPPDRPQRRSSIRTVRTVAECSLAGAVTAGVLFNWAPVHFDVHVVGAVIGAALGVLAVAKKFI